MDNKQRKSVRRLGLHRETIRELQRDELRQAAGGVATVAAGCDIIATLVPLTVCECTGNYTYQCN